MIASLRGTLLYKDSSAAVVECGGVGFRCSVTRTTASRLPQIGTEVFLNTWLAVREDAMELFGFFDAAELECFRMITGVSGVGAKIGLAILSEFPPERVMLFIASSDPKSLTAASGVGNKLAQRIVLELKDKVGKGFAGDDGVLAAVGNAEENLPSRDAIDVLVSLGYNRSDASLAVGRLDQSLSTENMIKQAVKTLSRSV